MKKTFKLFLTILLYRKLSNTASDVKHGVTALVLFIFTLIYSIPYTLHSAVKVVPYYSLQFTEGVFIPNTGEWNFSINLLNDIGVIVKPAGKHSFVGFYELKYTGPGLKRQEGEKFTDRTMDHLGVIRHTYNITENYFVKSQIDYMKEYKRTGSNEVWGTGLYDFGRVGGVLSLGRKFSEQFFSSVSGQYHFLNFPNYTDLLAEFQAGGASVESSTGKQNHSLVQMGFSVDYDVNRLSLDLTFQNYTKQKVIMDTVQSDGTYYSSELQKDIIINISGGRRQDLWERVFFEPTVSYKIKSSNQNYQHFETATSSIPVRYFDSYYDYNQFIFSLPVSFVLGEKWEISSTPEFDIKSYTKRPSRNSDGDFLDKKQRSNLFILSNGFTFKPNVVTRTTLFYIFQNQSSNMKFEKYLPYNYSGSYLGIKFEYTY